MAPNSLIDVCNAPDFCRAFVENKNLVFQYSARDVQDQLEKQELDALLPLHKTLSAMIQADFPEYSNKKPINRQSKSRAVSDIYVMGYSLVNDSPARELDKIFIHGVLNDSQADNTQADRDDFAELLISVADMRRELSEMQEAVNELTKDNEELKATVDALRQQLAPTADADQGPGDGASAAAPSEQPSSAVQSENASQVPVSVGQIPGARRFRYSFDTGSSSSDSDISEASEVFQQQRRQRQKRRRRRPQRGQPSLGQTSRLKSVARPSTSQQAQPKAAYHIGHVDPAQSADDIVAHLRSLGCATSPTIRCLRARDDWKSFCVELSRDKANEFFHGNLWPSGVVVRPFRSKERADAAQPQKAHLKAAPAAHQPKPQSTRQPRQHPRAQTGNQPPGRGGGHFRSNLRGGPRGQGSVRRQAAVPTTSHTQEFPWSGDARAYPSDWSQPRPLSYATVVSRPPSPQQHPWFTTPQPQQLGQLQPPAPCYPPMYAGPSVPYNQYGPWW